MPTLLDLLGIPSPPMHGISLRPLMQGEAEAEAEAQTQPDRAVFSENQWGAKLYSGVFGSYHLIANRKRAKPPKTGETPDEAIEQNRASEEVTYQLYDWHDDPLEANDLLATDPQPDRDRQLRSALDQRMNELAYARSVNQPQKVPKPSAEERDHLRALGYVDVD
jgi:hypothetical protein